VPTPAVRDPDQLSYTARQVRGILPRAVAYLIWGESPQGRRDGPSSHADPAHGGVGMVEILDVLRALQQMPRAAVRVVLRVCGQGLTLTEAADLEGITSAEARTLWSTGTGAMADWLSGT
jgi:DNA-directed RNA polymerase specialized sigma24 family protein